MTPGKPTTADNNDGNGVSHHAKIKNSVSANHAPGIPPKLWIGSCRAVCDQLGSEGLKLSKAAINQTANRTIRISNASRRRRPLLNFVNVTSLSSVYSGSRKALRVTGFPARC